MPSAPQNQKELEQLAMNRPEGVEDNHGSPIRPRQRSVAARSPGSSQEAEQPQGRGSPEGGIPAVRSFEIAGQRLPSAPGESAAKAMGKAAKQVRGLAEKRKAVVGGLQERLFSMEVQCDVLSQDYSHLASVDGELGRVAQALKGAFAAERASLGTRDHDEPPAAPWDD